MNGECKSFRLNDPMTKAEFLSMPDDLKVTYIKLIRNKYGIPDSYLGTAMCFPQQSFARLVKKLGLSKGKGAGKAKWDKEGFYAWWHGVDKLPEPVPEDPVEAPVIEKEPVHFYTEEEREIIRGLGEEKGYVEDDLPFEEPDPVQADECEVADLKAVHEKDKVEYEWLLKECDSLRWQVRILEAQMDVVRLIFGGQNRG